MSISRLARTPKTESTIHRTVGVEISRVSSGRGGEREEKACDTKEPNGAYKIMISLSQHGYYIYIYICVRYNKNCSTGAIRSFELKRLIPMEGIS